MLGSKIHIGRVELMLNTVALEHQGVGYFPLGQRDFVPIAASPQLWPFNTTAVKVLESA